uniref:Uncharacterized protein n=1 Tax=Panagrolaimus davidi TaxID=227884 RepID=A0A914Q537_9BILA
MNQTYTIGTKQNPLQQSLKGRERSCSIDSDIAEYTISGAISGLFPRAYNRSNSNIPTTTSTNRTPTRSPSSSTLTRVFSTKLPSLDGCSPERKCCQRPNFGRAQFDLQKFKETIKNAH